jgi:short-subunit dehydrogenase
MKKNILITWTSKWIWKYLVNDLKSEYEIIWISRSKSEEIGFKQINIDLTNPSFFNNIINYFEQSDKKLDVVIINAWVGHFGKYEEWCSEKYKEIINLNLLSPILLIKELEPYLNNKAKIIFIGSIISKKFMKYGAVYQASKFGLRWFAWALKNEIKWKWVHIINPRIVDTTFHDKAKIDIEMWNRETKLEDISETIKWIINWKENRFEIDL